MRWFAATLFLCALVPANDPILNGDTFAAWRDAIVPGADERPDEGIEWAPSLSEGLVRAAAEGKPLLLWMMNGHPLGCT